MKRTKLQKHKDLSKGDVMELLGKELDVLGAFIVIRKYRNNYAVDVSGFK